MAITASAKSGAPRKLPPAGTHVARCYQIIDLGTHDKEWQGRARKSHEIRISWELPNELAVFKEEDGEQPFAVHKTYTLSLSEKANLLHDLQSWRGKAFTEAELAAFDVCKVLGAPCMVTIMHVEKSGNTYANVTTVTSIPKGMTCPKQFNPSLEYSTAEHDDRKFNSLPDFLRKIIAESDEYKALNAPEVVLPENIQGDGFDGDEIPMEDKPSLPF